MSFKAKNLSYESNEPAFLRKLRNEYGGIDSARQQHPLARPRKQKTGDDADDEPVYVHEDTLDTISKDEYTALLTNNKHQVKDDQTPSSPSGGELPEKAVFRSTDEQLDDAKPAEELQANIGSNSKRRLVKAIGDSHEARDSAQSGDGTSAEDVNQRGKKKRKKIKLSFEEEVES